MNAPEFKNRWLITGNLTTQSELHIGDGGAGTLNDRARPADKEKEESDASTVRVDYKGRAYLPGSGIKGPLRALVSDARGNILPKWRELFGSDTPNSADAVGGKLEFWDAFWIGGNGKDHEQPDPKNLHKAQDRSRPWWDNTRRTCVAVAVSLDRRTRTAKENLLYHLEYVPSGEIFHFEVSGDNLEEADIEQFLALLGSFNRGETSLGAQASNGWGRMECKIESVKLLDALDLESWKKNPTVGLAAAATTAPGFENPNNLLNGLSSQCDLLTIQLSLTTDSPWLIRDPRQRERNAHKPDGSLIPHAVPIYDEFGKPFVPAKSLRGALRSRAEMILRTVGFQIEDHPSKISVPTTKEKGTDDAVVAIQKLDDLAAKLFGFSDWQGPLHIPRLTSSEKSHEHHQEFVAIDRFTGGAADGAKFDAKLAGMTVPTGILTVDLGRLARVDSKFASLGLLALVLRDLAEGDISIGSGAAKGQGQCHAEAAVTHEGESYPTLSEWFVSKQVTDALTAFRNSIPTTATP